MKAHVIRAWPSLRAMSLFSVGIQNPRRADKKDWRPHSAAPPLLRASTSVSTGRAVFANRWLFEPPRDTHNWWAHVRPCAAPIEAPGQSLLATHLSCFPFLFVGPSPVELPSVSTTCLGSMPDVQQGAKKISRGYDADDLSVLDDR